MDTFEGSVRHCYTVMGSCWRGCWLANGRSIPMIPHTVVPQIQRAASHTKSWDPCSLHFSSHLPEQCFWGWEPEVMGGHGEALKFKFSTRSPIQKVRVSKSDSPSKMDGLAGIWRKSQARMRQATPAGLDPEAQPCRAALLSPTPSNTGNAFQ